MTQIQLKVNLTQLPTTTSKWIAFVGGNIAIYYYLAIFIIIWGLLELLRSYTHFDDLALALIVGGVSGFILIGFERTLNLTDGLKNISLRYIPYFKEAINDALNQEYIFNQIEIRILLQPQDKFLSIEDFYKRVVASDPVPDNYTFGSVVKDYGNHKYTFTLKWNRIKGFYLEQRRGSLT